MSSPAIAIPLTVPPNATAITQPDHEVLRYQAPASLPVDEDSKKKRKHDQQQANADADEEECSICLETLSSENDHIVTIKSCGHSFHQDCITECLTNTMKCPNCRAPAGDPQGPGPSGTMRLRKLPTACPGFSSNTTLIEITYQIPRGTQRSYHESPGQVYHHTNRVAYLPDDANGQALANRLKYAFDHGLTFRIGTSLTTQRPNSVTWASVPHKTTTSGGEHGFPDDKYLDNCNTALDNLHVPANTNQYDGMSYIDYQMPDRLTSKISLPDALERSCAVAATIGRSPSGTMTILRTPNVCPGFGMAGTFEILYSMPGNLQMPYHPNPNVLHSSTDRCAYIPDTPEGVTLLQRLKYAFLHGLIFDIGRSLTNGRENQIIWSTIPHMTSMTDPASPYSFPNDRYIDDCHAKLDAAGVPRNL